MNNHWLARFWGVLIRPQTYLNLAYLFLAFPLGLVYFVFLVTGLSLGFPLIILWVGLIILAVVFAASWGLTLFERQMAIWLLRVEIGSTGDPVNPNDDIWQRFKKYIANPVTWKGLLFLLLKFPLGVISFTIGTTLMATSLGLVLSPIGLIFFPNASVRFFEMSVHPAVAASIFFIIGILLVPVSLHILNGLAYVYGQIARLLLGKLEPEKKVVPVAPVTPAAASVEPSAPVMSEPSPEPAVAPEAPAPETAVEALPADPLANLFPSGSDAPDQPEPPAES